MPSGPGLFFLLVPLKAALTSTGETCSTALPGGPLYLSSPWHGTAAGKEISMIILVVSSWWSAVTPRCEMAGTVAERWGPTWRVAALGSSAVASFGGSSGVLRHALRIALRKPFFAVWTSSGLALPPLRLRTALASALLFSLISSFRQRLGLAQMVTFLTSLLRIPRKPLYLQTLCR